MRGFLTRALLVAVSATRRLLLAPSNGTECAHSPPRDVGSGNLMPDAGEFRASSSSAGLREGARTSVASLTVNACGAGL